MKNGTQGFTLIELLIVIAIIGILAAVLIPNLLGARARANDTVAKAYLNDAVKIQEISQVDTQTYINEADLNTKGLKADTTAGVTFAVVAQSATGYCMTATHPGGSTVGSTTKTFFATAAGGIQEVSSTTPACTTAG